MNVASITTTLALMAAVSSNQGEPAVRGFSSELAITDPYATTFTNDGAGVRIFPGDDATFTYCPPPAALADATTMEIPPLHLLRGSGDIPMRLPEFADTVHHRKVDRAVVASMRLADDSGEARCWQVRIADQPEGLYGLVVLATAAPAGAMTMVEGASFDSGVSLDFGPPRTDSERLFMHYRRGRRAAMNARWSEALASADRLLELSPDSTDAHLLKIEVLARMGRTQDALQALELAGRRLPEPAKQTKLRRAIGPNSREDFCWIARTFLDLPVEDDCRSRRVR